VESLYHCNVNRKHKTPHQKGKEYLECGCSMNKGVAEQLLLNMGVIGKDIGDDDLVTLSDTEWYKMDHVMGSLFG
jgi:hypothetical protein